MRRAIESTIERLIGMLDALDGDADLEEAESAEDDDADEDHCCHAEAPDFGIDQTGWPRNPSAAWARGLFTDAWRPA